MLKSAKTSFSLHNFDKIPGGEKKYFCTSYWIDFFCSCPENLKQLVPQNDPECVVNHWAIDTHILRMTALNNIEIDPFSHEIMFNKQSSSLKFSAKIMRNLHPNNSNKLMHIYKCSKYYKRQEPFEISRKKNCNFWNRKTYLAVRIALGGSKSTKMKKRSVKWVLTKDWNKGPSGITFNWCFPVLLLAWISTSCVVPENCWAATTFAKVYICSLELRPCDFQGRKFCTLNNNILLDTKFT